MKDKQHIIYSNTSDGTYEGILTGYFVERSTEKSEPPIFVKYSTERIGYFVPCTQKGDAAVGVVSKFFKNTSNGPVAVFLLGSNTSTLLVTAGGKIKHGDFLITDEQGHAIALPEEPDCTCYVLGRALGTAAKGTQIAFDPYFFLAHRA